MTEYLNVEKEFRYSPGWTEKSTRAGRLSLEQRKFYEDNGFLVIPKLVPDDLLDACKQRFLDLINGVVNRGSITMMRDISLKGQKGISQERLVNKIQDFCWDDVLAQYIGYPRILDYVENFTGPNIRAMHTMVINKPPDSGKLTSRHPWHQDLHYFPFRPADRIVASWTAMERVDDRNGCLIVFPGTHRQDVLHQHEYPSWENGVNKMYHGIEAVDQKTGSKGVELHMEKGDTVFFHPLLVHGSGPNRTDGFRKAISCHFASSDCYYIDVTGTTQENIAKEIVDIAQAKGITDVGVQDIWHVKSRCVRGLEGKL